MQLVLAVCQQLRSSLCDEKLHNEQMREEVENAVGKVSAAFEISQTDQDTIERLKLEIGKPNNGLSIIW